jgi:hypothetical protein
MKKRLLKFVLPISLGLMLSLITLFALISTTFVGCGITCPKGELKGTDDNCYSCPDASSHATYSYEGAGCSNPVAGVYCCPGGGSTGCSPKTGCPTYASWLGNDGHCYATSNECIAAQTGTTKKCRQCN